MADLARAAVDAPVQIAAENQPAAHACGHGHINHVSEAAPRAQPVLGQRRGVGIVVHEYRQGEPFLEHFAHGGIVKLVEIRRFQKHAGGEIHMRGKGRAQAAHFLQRHARPARQLARIGVQRVHHFPGGQFRVGWALDYAHQAHLFVKQAA